MKLFGIPTYAEEDWYSTVVERSEMIKGIKSDVDGWYKRMKAITSRDLTGRDWQFYVNIERNLFNLYDDPEERSIALEHLSQLMDMDKSNTGENLAVKLAKMIQYPHSNMAERMNNLTFNNQAISQENRQALQELHDTLTKNFSEGEE